VADDDRVLAFRRHGPEERADGRRAPLVLTGRHDQPTFSDVEDGFYRAQVQQFGRLPGAVELARHNLADRNLEAPERRPQRLGLVTAFVSELTLGPDVVQVQWVGVGLIWIGRRVAEDQNLASFLEGGYNILFRLRVGGYCHHVDKDEN